MSVETTVRARGTIIKVPDASHDGLVIIGGQQKAFALEGIWKSPLAPTVNMVVEVDVDDAGSIVRLAAADEDDILKESLHQLGGVAQKKGKRAARLATKALSVLATRMGRIAFAATILLWFAGFLLPAGSLGAESFTFWQFLGFDLTNLKSLVSLNSSHGYLSLAVLVAFAAPFAVPFIPYPQARFLNLFPLGCLVLVVLTAQWETRQLVRHAQDAAAGLDPEMRRIAADLARTAVGVVVDAAAFGFGSYVLGAAALALTALPFRRRVIA